MQTIIKIEKEDIITSRIGMNILVKIDEKCSLILTPDSIDELIKDYIEIKKDIEQTHNLVEEKVKEFTSSSKQLEILF